MKSFVLLLFFVTLFFSVDSFSQITSKQREGLRVDSVLKNPSFESGFSGWSITGGCDKETIQVSGYLNKSLKLTCTSSTFSIKQNTTKFVGLANQDINLGFQASATASGVSYSGLLDNTRVSGVTAPIYKTTGMQRYEKNDLSIGATSNGIEIYSDTPWTGTLIIDDIGFSVAPNTVVSEIAYQTDWESCNTSGGWSTNTTYSCRYQRNGDSAVFQVTASLSGAPNASDLTFVLPNS